MPTIISEKTEKLLTLSLVKGIGPKKLQALANGADFTLGLEDLLVKSLGPKEADGLFGRSLLLKKAQDEASRQIEAAHQYGARIISSVDDDYPALLKATPDDPVILYVRGKWAQVPENSIAVVGSRKASSTSLTIADRITRFLIEKGFSIVSGLALGCDTAAHKAALDAKGHTVAVLAHGLHMILPEENRTLGEAMVQEGSALVSQFPFGTEPLAVNYPMRNRVQAALSRGVVMIASDLEGGSLVAPRAALSYGRWMAAPYPTELERKTRLWNVEANVLLADGADGEKFKLMHTEPSLEVLDRIIILRSKHDYEKFMTLTPLVEKSQQPYDVLSQAKQSELF